jgi:hypothetical protein
MHDVQEEGVGDPPPTRGFRLRRAAQHRRRPPKAPDRARKRGRGQRPPWLPTLPRNSQATAAAWATALRAKKGKAAGLGKSGLR